MNGGRATPLRAVRDDPRFSWCAYLPARPATRTVVLVHGSDRDPVALIRAFTPWAEERSAALVAPLFPGGVPDLDDLDGYKQAVTVAFSFADVLDVVMRDAAARHSVPAEPFDLFGFSGGAQFAHRYALLRPARVRSLAIIAPGNVTLLAPGRRWWAGVDDLAELQLGQATSGDVSAIPVLAAVGAEDDGREVISISPEESRWVPGANDAGATRVERLQALVADWRSAGVDVHHIVAPGVAHDFHPFVEATQSFFDANADDRRAFNVPAE